MLKAGLTGNIGSGKSLIADLFSFFGVPVYNADSESKKLLGQPIVKEKVINLFGEKVLNLSGDIDRNLLAALAFANGKALSSLNSILHPLVLKDFQAWCLSMNRHPYIIEEAAILFESGANRFLNKVIHVSCPPETAVKRVILRDKINRDKVLQRMQFQMDDGEKSRLADYVIQNPGNELLIPQVLRIHEELTALAGSATESY